MKNPNGYGSVINLGKGRRRPWAARVTTGLVYDEKKDKLIQRYKYIGYADTRKEAHQILAEYNAGLPIKDNLPRTSLPTFKEIWEGYSAAKFNPDKKKPVSKDTVRNYTLAYNRFSELHDRKIVNITAPELQVILDRYKDKSLSTVGTMKSVLNQMYRYAKKYYDVEDITKTLEIEYTDSANPIHKPFTQNEIDWLWDHSDDYRAQFVLMMIYTGVRPQEFVKIETKNVHLDENYFVGGLKTDAGRERIIPIHSKVKKFFESNYHPEKQYLIMKSNFKELTYRDRHDNFSYALFINTVWTPYMCEIGMDHLGHDPRHTFATLMDKANVPDNILKSIMGHAQTDEKGRIDVTNAVYIHKTIEDLREAVEKI